MRRDGIGSTLLSIVLAATMTVGLCPTPAMANPSDGHDQEALQPQEKISCRIFGNAAYNTVRR